MGIDTVVGVSVEFTQEVQVPRYMSRFVKRLLQWQPEQISIDSVVSRQLGKKRMRTRAVGSVQPANDNELDEDDLDACAFSDVPGEEDFDARRKELLQSLREDCLLRLREETPAQWRSSHYWEMQFDLCHNHPQLIFEAFDLAQARLFPDEAGPGLGSGPWARDQRASRRQRGGGTVAPANKPEDLVIKLRYENSGNDVCGIVGENAKFSSMRLVLERAEVRAVRPSDGGPWGGVDMGRYSVDVPWGVAHTPLPTLKEAEVAAARSKFRKICDSFGLQPLGEAGWHLVTSAHTF